MIEKKCAICNRVFYTNDKSLSICNSAKCKLQLRRKKLLKKPKINLIIKNTPQFINYDFPVIDKKICGNCGKSFYSNIDAQYCLLCEKIIKKPAKKKKQKRKLRRELTIGEKEIAKKYGWKI